MTTYTITPGATLEITDFAGATAATFTAVQDVPDEYFELTVRYTDNFYMSGEVGSGSITQSGGSITAEILQEWIAISLKNWSASDMTVTVDLSGQQPPVDPEPEPEPEPETPAAPLKYFGARKYSGLQLSGIDLPIGSDRDIKVAIGLIGEASDLRRTVNADLINLSRAVFRKYFANVTGSGLRPAALAGLTPGDYVELIAPEPLAISCRSPLSSVELPRAGVDVIGLTSEGERVLPDAQPISPLPLQIDRTSGRIATLRTKPVVTFATPVVSVRYRAALACAVVSWSSDSDERLASSSWSLSLEEI